MKIAPLFLLPLLLLPSLHAQQLTAAEAQSIITNAATAAAGEGMAAVVVDRPGNILAIFRRSQAKDSDVEMALSLARTGAYFSMAHTPLSSRTVRAMSRPNLPEGVANQPAGPLYGIENSNRGCPLNNVTQLQPVTVPSGAYKRFSNGIATVPGGVGLYRNGETVIGGVGVYGLGDDLDEYASVMAGFPSFFVHLPLPEPGAIYVGGLRLPFVFFAPLPGYKIPAGLSPGPAPGSGQITYGPMGPVDGQPAPDGYLVGPAAGQQLSLTDVTTIMDNSIQTALLARAALRLPVGMRTTMVISVSDLDGTILALYRMPDATTFSLDVAMTKARNMVYFSGPNRDPAELPGVPMNTAVTSRTIGYGSQPFYPSGFFNSQPGPFYDTLFNLDTANPCTQGHQPANSNQSGIAFFPGALPLYRNGQVIGGVGVSGDGVEQDDFVAAAGARGFEAPAGIRADQIFIRGVRLPYLKFPRNAEQ